MTEPAPDPVATAREHLFEEIYRDFRDTAKWTGRDRPSPRTMAALARVRRETFVPAELAVSAYVNRPLGIGHGQTISQPLIVALMTDFLDLEGGETVLEIGTGSGYQAAVLAAIAGQVLTIETVAELSTLAQAALARAGYANIQFRVGDGRAGWPEAAPFAAIIVTAAAESIPDSLIAQLAPGGRMIIPVGKRNGPQNLVLVQRDETWRIAKRNVLPVAFVPLVGRD